LQVKKCLQRVFITAGLVAKLLAKFEGDINQKDYLELVDCTDTNLLVVSRVSEREFGDACLAS
jgi:hypothetical protein